MELLTGEFRVNTVALGIELASWAEGLQIATSVPFALKRNGMDVPTDQYELDLFSGHVLRRLRDAAGNPVTWDLTDTFTATYATYDPVTYTTSATHTDEAQTYGDLDFVPLPWDPSLAEWNPSHIPGLIVTAQQFADTIESDNFVPGSAGWRITRAGDGEVNNWTVRGTVVATTGSIGGWTIAASPDRLVKDTGSNATSAGMAPSDFPFYAGATYANRATAPFRVNPAGAITADNINLAGGSVSGTFTVSGNLRSAASPNARYEFTGTGLRGWDAGNNQRYQILNDGSGWLGSPSFFSWNTGGVVSINGGAVQSNTLDASKINTTFPLVSELVLTPDSPSSGRCAWTSFKITYKGTTYTVSAGDHPFYYGCWTPSAPTSVTMHNTVPALTSELFILWYWDGYVTHTLYPSITSPFIYGAYISAGTIQASHITVSTLSALSANLGTITAGTITGGTIRTAASGARVEMNATKLFGTDGATTQWETNAATGAIQAGGGTVTLGSSGLGVEVTTTDSNLRSYQFMSGATILSRLSAYTNTTVNWLTLKALSQAGKGSFTQLHTNAPSGQISAATMEIQKGGATVGKFELLSNASNEAYAYVSDVSGLVIGSSAVVATHPLHVYSGGIEQFRVESDGDLRVTGNLILGTATGTKIGTSASQKLGFWDATPIVRPTGYTQNYVIPNKTAGVLTASTMGGGAGSADGDLDNVGSSFNQTILNNNFMDVKTMLNALQVDIINLKQVQAAIIDDLQAVGLFA